MKTSRELLIQKLHRLDERLVNIWLTDDPDISDEDIWEIFVVLLESRVELLKTCRDAGLKLSREVCLPDWLDRLVSKKQELKLREIRLLALELKNKKKISAFEETESLGRKSSKGAGIDESV